MATLKRVYIVAALAIVTLAVIVALLAVWNNQRAAAVDTETCENGACAACVEPLSCCADAEDVHKELSNV